MDRKGIVESVQNALRLLNEVEDSDKERGFDLLERALERNDEILAELGYDQVIFKELIKSIQFESGHILDRILDLCETYYFNKPQNLDELAETLIYRIARSNDSEICRTCLSKISTLIDCFDDSIAKHSKQLLKLADLNDLISLNPILCEILEKLKSKLPRRKNNLFRQQTVNS